MAKARVRSGAEAAAKKVGAMDPMDLAAKLQETDDWIYSDEGCDGNGAKGIWGKSGHGAVIYACAEDGTVTEVANLFGPVVTDAKSDWYIGAERGTNQTGELCGVVMALLWLIEHAFDDDDVVICVDSLYAGNQLEGFWRVNCNKDLIEYGQEVLRQVREKRDVTFIHVKGHSTDGGNDRADLLVQWGKSDGPFSRMRRGGGGEGAGRFGAIALANAPEGHREQPVAATPRWSDTEEDTEREQYVFDQMEAMLSEDGLQADERMRDSTSSAGSVLRMSAWADETDSDEEEEEIVETQKKIANITDQIAAGDRGDSLETMEEIMQLERVTVAAGAMSIESVENTRMDGVARRMQQCWISTIGYRTSVPAPPLVCDNVRSDRITVQGGSRGPIPNT